MAKALIALSGGVDSAVAAYLMKQQGYDCIGAMMQLLDGQSTDDAKAVCDNLGIPFYAFDMRDEFKNTIIDDFVTSFENGETPNPCVLCNKKLKFGALFQKMQELDCDVLVTGHYARIEETSGEFRLKKAENTAKDQSYFLYSLDPNVLKHVRFPLGGYTKDQIREIAENIGFSVARKKDSQDICFVPDGDYVKVITDLSKKHYKKGNFVDLAGSVLGTHQGIINYTVGQRKGLGIAFGKPMYVYRKNAETNEVTLCDDNELFTDTLEAKNINLLTNISLNNLKCKARIRYRHEEQPATVTQNGDTVTVKFDTPQRAITPGQSVVFFDGDIVLGGGIIK